MQKPIQARRATPAARADTNLLLRHSEIPSAADNVATHRTKRTKKCPDMSDMLGPLGLSAIVSPNGSDPPL
jgi:hypothetical protein